MAKLQGWLNPSLTRFDRVLCKNPIDNIKANSSLLQRAHKIFQLATHGLKSNCRQVIYRKNEK